MRVARETRSGSAYWEGPLTCDGDMVPGDTMEVENRGIGTLRN